MIEDFETDMFELDVFDPQVLNHFRRCIQFDENMYSKYGPFNPHIPKDGEVKFCEKSPNGKCCMMECMCYEEDDDWFVGQCLVCEKKINNKYEASRTPMSKGGFIGCQCSVQCDHRTMMENTAAEEHDLIEIFKHIRNRFPIKPDFEDFI